MTRHDIETREDVDRLLERFYESAMVDPMIAHHFTELDLETHLPVIGDFWEKLLFSRPVYFGNPLIVHRQLHERHELEPPHFDRWVEIFRATVDEMFDGPRADVAKFRAGVIAGTLSERLHSVDLIPPDTSSRGDVRPN
ncbi:MAG TPA: group III truncated hemoglobin [Pyrinomonadaceae bacterium]|jgi:hemoglobin|nr:group III truncated hemoglobin [Pyrinomonadaceae bacterium]